MNMRPVITFVYCFVTNLICNKPIPKLIYLNFQKEIINHREQCMFRIVTCPRPDCDTKFKFTKVHDHFDSHSALPHEKYEKYSKISYEIGGVLRVGLSDYYFNEWYGYLKVSPIEMEMYGNLFLFITYRDHSTKYWHFYVTLIGSKKNAEKFRCHISLHSQFVSILILKYPLKWILNPLQLFFNFN